MAETSGKVAIVTGGGSGIGEATALRFGRDGAAVLVADINGEAALAVEQNIIKAGGKAKAFQCDLTTLQGAEAMVEAALSSFGHFDYAFNNVGGALPGSELPVHEVDMELFDADLRLNLYSAVYCLRAEIPHLLKQGHGSIVITSSLAGLGGSPSNTSYTIGKHGVIGLAKNAAIAYGRQNIRVNVICPGTIETPLVAHNFAMLENWQSQLGAGSALGRIAKPQEVANLVVWLCSDEASFMTGAVIPIDGGSTAYVTRSGNARKKN